MKNTKHMRYRSQEIQKSKPLYLQLEEKFNREFVLPEIESQKKKLEEIKQSRITPIDHTDLEKHRKQYEEQVKQLTQQKMELRKQAASEHNFDPKKYQNHFTKLVKRKEREKQRKEEERQRAKMRYLKARKNISDINDDTNFISDASKNK